MALVGPKSWSISYAAPFDPWQFWALRGGRVSSEVRATRRFRELQDAKVGADGPIVGNVFLFTKGELERRKAKTKLRVAKNNTCIV